MMQRAGALLVISAVACATSGCTLVGLTLGATAPAYDKPTTLEALREHQRKDNVATGPEVRVALSDGTDIDGAYVGETLGVVGLATNRGLTTVAVGEVKRVDEKTGSHWARGVLIGGAIDIALVIATVALMSSIANIHEAPPR